MPGTNLAFDVLPGRATELWIGSVLRTPMRCLYRPSVCRYQARPQRAGTAGGIPLWSYALARGCPRMPLPDAQGSQTASSAGSSTRLWSYAFATRCLVLIPYELRPLSGTNGGYAATRFWWLHTLATAARSGHSAVCRQALVGRSALSCYARATKLLRTRYAMPGPDMGLVCRRKLLAPRSTRRVGVLRQRYAMSGADLAHAATSFRPNPDYWTALLWRRLVGTRILAGSQYQ
eukprot:749532-Rhodomonas_salina.1